MTEKVQPTSADGPSGPPSLTKPSEILSAAADLIEPEGRWTQGAFARDPEGHIVLVQDPRATCFCAAGAIYRVAGPRPFKGGIANLIDQVAKPLQDNGRFRGVADFNDRKDRRQAEVVAHLRKAAEKARKAGQ